MLLLCTALFALLLCYAAALTRPQSGPTITVTVSGGPDEPPVTHVLRP